ncbi:hypothetical protein F5148DRAFT_1251615, partial [Russula earlei]
CVLWWGGGGGAVAAAVIVAVVVVVVAGTLVYSNRSASAAVVVPVEAYVPGPCLSFRGSTSTTLECGAHQLQFGETRLWQ